MPPRSPASSRPRPGAWAWTFGCLPIARKRSRGCRSRRRLRFAMLTKNFTGGRIRKAEYDPATNQLDLHWDDKSGKAYKQVPQEVFRRLCAAPNPATYWEERIPEEYPKGAPRTG